MEIKVQQIWHVLSGYEESSAALIGEMLRAVNGQQLLEIILLAEKFILHVEVLFAVIDDLEAQFALAGVKGGFPDNMTCADSRDVTRTRSKAAMPETRQPILDDVANRPWYRNDIEQHGSVHLDHPARALLEDSNTNHIDRLNQVGEGLWESHSYAQCTRSPQPARHGQFRSGDHETRRACRRTCSETYTSEHRACLWRYWG